MSEINTGGPAFPLPDIDGGKVCEGMTLRDYFAAKAMHAALITVHPAAQESVSDVIYASVKAAYQAADAMLKAREA